MHVRDEYGVGGGAGGAGGEGRDRTAAGAAPGGTRTRTTPAASNVVFTGHSMGGGIASVLGFLLKRPVVAFQPPGIYHSIAKFDLISGESALRSSSKKQPGSSEDPAKSSPDVLSHGSTTSSPDGRPVEESAGSSEGAPNASLDGGEERTTSSPPSRDASHEDVARGVAPAHTTPQASLQHLHHQSLTVTVDADFINYIFDHHGGLLQQINCDLPARSMYLACHTLEGTINHWFKSCGDSRERFEYLVWKHELPVEAVLEVGCCPWRQASGDQNLALDCTSYVWIVRASPWRRGFGGRSKCMHPRQMARWYVCPQYGLSGPTATM